MTQSKAPNSPHFASNASNATGGDVGGGWAAHALFFLLIAALLAFGAWMALARVDVVSQAPGEVVPSSQVKQVQHLEGGIVNKILVREGQTVTEGEPLLELESTASGADVAELAVRETTLRVRVARLEAETNRAETIAIPADLAEAHPRVVAEARAFFAAREAARVQDRNKARETVTQKAQFIEEIAARIRNGEKKLRLVNEQIALSADLLKDNLTTRFNHLEFLRQKEEIAGSLEEDKAALIRAQAALDQAKAEEMGMEAEWAADLREEMEDARGTLNELRQRQAKYEDTLGRTILRSPVDGIVKSLNFVTLGGVIRPGEVVADIVPSDDRLVIDARLATQDVAYVREGQLAVVRLASQDAMRFGGLEGTVVGVSPDTLEDKDGNPYYEVRVETDQDHFLRDGHEYRLFPGMRVTANIHTHRRTILDYLLSPFLDGLDVALGER
ncbi:MAG: HlyD family type I secretion periplasmic adaptor subunit [Rhodospirillum sp.]|nr:HlyD family type I secretion periplasmic adaptor subunit [Rhodospirillum sp.]MCF8489856.1 HlyD family type I secretion periplasmic adaptor subunit [Rhodospirillum sp.]MCF8499419.1 HlyD family type I secretion periplasmic adaptor subunit [Rhodospirillum sp.]